MIQKHWSEGDLIELVRMVGIISSKAQAKYLRRTQQSRKGALCSHFKVGSDLLLHGLPRTKAQPIVDSSAEYLFINARHRYICLWVEIERTLRADMPAHLRIAAKAMGQWQRWLYQTDDVMTVVKQMIKEREVWNEV